jgi:hypothetical protein
VHGKITLNIDLKMYHENNLCVTYHNIKSEEVKLAVRDPKRGLVSGDVISRITVSVPIKPQSPQTINVQYSNLSLSEKYLDIYKA